MLLKNIDSSINLEFFGEVSIYYGIGIQIIFALILGGLVGYDREVKLKAAGLKTNIMICIGACLYTTISMINIDPSANMIDPNRVSAQIVSGIGFLGAGAIIQGRGSVTGLTTAATIWVVAAIGYTIGVGYPIVATLFSVTVLVVLKLMTPLNKFIEREADFHNFHIEMLTYGEMPSIVTQVLNHENIEIISVAQEVHAEKKHLHISDIYVRAHYRALERITNELTESIKINKINFTQIDQVPLLVAETETETNLKIFK